MKSPGFTIIEFIVAAGIFMIIAAASVVALMHSGMIDRKGSEQEKARRYAQEGIEAVRSIRNQDFGSLVAGTHGVSSTGGTWAFSGTQNVNAGMTRQIVVADVYRDGNNTIVTSGGTLDPDTKKATITVTWTAENGKQQTIVQDSYLTNYKKTTGGCTNWDTPAQESSLDISGTGNGLKIQTQGNYAYFGREGTTNNFGIVDITNSASPILRSTISLNGSGQNNLAVLGNYVYISSYSDTRELQIINVSNPASPSLAGSYNAAGSADAIGIHLDVNRVYITRVSSTDREIFVLNVTNPAAPSSLGSFELGSNGEEIIVMGNYAYVTTSSDTQELRILNISNPASITSVSSYNIPNNTYDGQSITGYTNRIFVGLNEGGVHIFDVTNPASPQLMSSYNAGDDVEYMMLSPDNNCLFMATDHDAGEFQVLDVSNPTVPTLYGSFSIADDINGVTYHSGKNRIFLNTKIDGGEFIGVQP